MKEVWKDVLGFEGRFQISNKGVLKNIQTNKILKQHVSKKGYATIATKVNGKNYCFRVHRLVAIAFIDNVENKSEVNHKDSDKLNNSIDNLEWVTPKENIHHSIINNTHVMPPVTKALSEEDRLFIKTHYKERDKDFGCRALARKFNVCHKTIQNILAD